MAFRSIAATIPHDQTPHPNPQPVRNISSRDLRKECRFPIEAVAVVRWEGGAARGLTRDISSKGIHVYGQFDGVRVGMYVEITAQLRSEGIGPKVNLILHAKVVRVEGGDLPGLAAANHRTAIRRIGPLDLLG
jgi:PilZ domain